MENKACGRQLHNKFTAENFKEAEKLIIAGIIARLNERYKDVCFCVLFMHHA